RRASGCAASASRPRSAGASWRRRGSRRARCSRWRRDPRRARSAHRRAPSGVHVIDQENATVREWSDLLARIRFGTVKVAGKTVRGATIKAVGYRAANYADSDGSRVRPGLPRLAVDLEIDHGTAKRAMQVLVRTGLLRLVRPGARPGHADEYQLTIPADLLDRDDIEVW